MSKKPQKIRPIVISYRAAIKHMSSCECGICGHFSEKECVSKECACCINFHTRSGSKAKAQHG